MGTNDMDNGGLQDLARLPVPVQTFLWRQIAPFVSTYLFSSIFVDRFLSNIFQWIE